MAQYPEQAKTLRSQLEQWTETLIPSGLPETDVAKITRESYAYYGLGEAAPKTSPKGRKNDRGAVKKDKADE